MSALIYIHGFLSSPLSFKALQTQAWLAQHHPDVSYHCPQLTPYPEQTRLQLVELVESLLPEPVYLIGSSLGGFWATWLVEAYQLRAILINPAVKPQDFMPNYIGMPLKSYHSDDVYTIEAQHIEEIKSADVRVLQKQYYWVLLQTADEVLDYRQALIKYEGCKHTIEEGGDHSFQGYENYLDKCFDFLTKID